LSQSSGDGEQSARGAKIDPALGQRGQFLVGRLFLIERLLQQAGAIGAAKLFRPRDSRSQRCSCKSRKPEKGTSDAATDGTIATDGTPRN
jgi:hypothetical protein